MTGRRTWVGALLIVAVLAGSGCSSGGGTAVHGLGASAAQWHSHHGAEYSSVVTDSSGRVQSYVLTLAPTRTLDQAVALVRADLPSDASASAPQLTVGIEQTKCEIVEFTSPALGRLLGGAHGGDVLATFGAESAVLMDTSKIERVTVVSGNENLPRVC